MQLVDRLIKFFTEEKETPAQAALRRCRAMAEQHETMYGGDELRKRIAERDEHNFATVIERLRRKE